MVQQSLEKLGIISAHEKPQPLYQSKTEFVDSLQIPIVTSHSIYSTEKIRYRNQKRAEYRELFKGNPSLACSIFLKLIELDQFQDDNDKKKTYLSLHQIYLEDRVNFSAFKVLKHNIIKQDITLGLRSVLGEYKSRSLREKLWCLSGVASKFLVASVGIWGGVEQLKSAFSPAYCLGDDKPMHYEQNTTISSIPQGPFNMSCFPAVMTNGTVTSPSYCSISTMVDCTTLSPSKYAPSVALMVGGVASVVSGVWDLFGNPQIYTDIRTWWNKESRESGILFDQEVLINTIHEAVIKVEDISMHEKLIKDALSLAKALLPRSGYVDVIQKVKDSLEEKSHGIMELL